MSRVALDAKTLTIDRKTRASLEKAKKEARIDRNSTCFKGKGSLSQEELIRSLWLVEEKKKEEYI